MERTAESPVPIPAAPYVGLRPYERHESHLLTGRDDDARFLTDKVFSARLTLLYASSGLGKSSLLRALVIPKLEEEDCRTLYLDAWTGERPEAELRNALRGLATSLGLGDVPGEAESLANLVRLVTADGRSLVLVLDQFEEFLLNHALRLDPLRKELANLVRAPDLDVHLLVALREEFLANLEPFREEIVSLFQSTYRLEPLDSDAVREAIGKPAKDVGVEYEETLLDRLVADLEARPAEPASGQHAAAADLPMLQIVCLEMWNEAVPRGLRTLTLDFYLKTLGGAQAILDAYVRKVMPRRWRDQLFTARLMTCLAPPSGLKISFTVSDLAAMSGLEAARIESELRRLEASDVRILRKRDIDRKERFELQHDALIPRIAPWRERVLGRHALARRGALLVGVVMALVLAAGWKSWYDEREMNRNSAERLRFLGQCSGTEQIPSEAGPAFDRVASYLLGHRKREAAWDKLAALMQQYEGCMPASYGIDTSGYGVIQPAPQGGDWPLVLRLGEERAFDEIAFLQSWYEAAADLTQRRGVPLPRRLAVVRDPTFPRDLVRIEARGVTMVELEVPEPEGAALIWLDESSPVLARDFHSYFYYMWKAWEAAAQRDGTRGWWAVPRWSLAVWNAAGVKVYHTSAAIAVALKTSLLSNREAQLSDGALRYLVARMAQDHEESAREAGTAFCAGLADALTRLLAGGQGLRHFPLLVDALTGIDPARWPAAVDTFAEHGYLAALAPVPGETLAGVVAKTRPLCDPAVWKADDPRLAAYREMEPWLSPRDPASVRVLVGPELAQAWAPDNRSLAPWVQDAIDDARDRFYAQLGMQMPGLRFRGAGAADPVRPREVRLGLLDRDETLEPARALPAEDRAAMQALLDELAPQVRGAAAAWVSSESVAALVEGLSPQLKSWLKERYPAPDLKRVLRATLLPASPAEPAAADRSLRYPEWLLRGLVFWEAAEGSREVAAIAAFLRELQRARLDAAAGAAAQAGSSRVAQAVDELLKDRVQTAQRLLAEAVHADGAEQVRTQFVRTYAARHRAGALSSVGEWCRNPTEPAPPDWARLRADIADLLHPGEGALPRKAARSLELCRVASYPQWRAERQAREAADLAAAGDPPASWPPAQALWLGQKILEHYDPVRDPPQWRDDGAALLGSALQRLPANKARDAFVQLLTQCGDTRRPSTWCWSVAQELARRVHGDPWMALDMANNLSRQVKVMGPEPVTEWLAEAERRLKHGEPASTVREVGLPWIRLIRAKARFETVRPGDTEAIEQLEQECRQLLGSAVAQWAHSSLTELLLFKRHAWREAERSARDGMERWHDDPAFVADAFLAVLMQGKQEEARQLIEHAESKAKELDESNPSRGEFLFVATLGHLLTGAGQWELAGRQFLQTGHQYVNVVAMLLHNRMSGRASREGEALVQARWRGVDRKSWPRRMQEGDGSAWLEILLGFYLGHVPPEELLPMLEDEAAFAASDFSKLPFARDGLLSDVYFYDALRRQRERDDEGMRRSLLRVIEIGGTDYYEYYMARYLLGEGRQAAASG